MTPYVLTGNLGQEPLRYEFNTEQAVFGRSLDSDVVIPDPAVSKRHCILIREGENLRIQDLGSRNGTLINGTRIEGSASVNSGDTIQLGNVNLTIKSSTGMSSSSHTVWGQVSEELSISTSIHEAKQVSGNSRILEALHEAGNLLSKTLKPDELNTFLLELLTRFLPVDRVFLLAAEQNESGPEIIAARHSEMTGDMPLQMSRTLFSQIVEGGRAFLIRDISAHADLAAQESIVSAGVQSAMAAPLYDHEEMLGAVYVDTRNPIHHLTKEDLQLLTLLANMVAVKMTNVRLEAAEAERERLQAELELASRIQQGFLPKVLPQLEGYEVFAFQEPCYEVGGDLYDLRLAPDGTLWFVLGDVTGKGIGAAMLMSNAMAILKGMGGLQDNPLDVVNHLHKHMRDSNDTGTFITLFLGVVDKEKHSLTYVNAGHNPPILMSGDGRRELESTGMPVALLPQAKWTAETITMNPGDRLLVFSDGIPECESEAETRLQYEDERFDKFLDTVGDLGVKDLGGSLLKDVKDFRGERAPSDDLTLLILGRP